MGEACATAQQMFGLARELTISGDAERGRDFFISPRGFRTASVINASGYEDSAHNAILVRVPMLWPSQPQARRGPTGRLATSDLPCPENAGPEGESDSDSCPDLVGSDVEKLTAKHGDAVAATADASSAIAGTV